MLKNVKPAAIDTTPRTKITDADEIRRELETSGITVGPDHDGEWAAVIEYDDGSRASTQTLHLVARKGDGWNCVLAYRERGTLSAGAGVWIEDGRLKVEW